MFIGRILPYKGLGLLVDAVESLRRDRLPLELGIFGRGKIEPSLLRRLSKLGAEVVNRWLYDTAGYWADPNMDMAAAELRRLRDNCILRPRKLVLEPHVL